MMDKKALYFQEELQLIVQQVLLQEKQDLILTLHQLKFILAQIGLLLQVQEQYKLG